MTDSSAGPGFQLPGYRLVNRIGSGGFSTVYEAVQLSLNRPVAVKILHADLESPADRARFEREREVLTQLSGHRHVVDVIDAGVTTEGRPFIVMRLCRRGSLARVLAESGPLPVPVVIDTVAKLASALQAAHNLGVVHRDVKPGNILITDDGEPVLADFGIAGILQPTGTASTSFFSMAHVAPEVLEQPQARLVASDTYSLASTSYMLLAGHPPFEAPTDWQRIRLIMEVDPPPIGRPDLPAPVEAVVRRAMAKDPQQRHPSVADFAQELQTAYRSWQEEPTAVGWPAPAPTPVPPTPVPPVQLPPVPPVQLPPVQPPPVQVSGGAAMPLASPGDTTRRPSRRGLIVGGIAAAAVTLIGLTYVIVRPFLTSDPAVGVTGPKTVVVSTDLPLRGTSKDVMAEVNRALQLYLKQIGGRVGSVTIKFKTYDTSTTASPDGDSAKCADHALAHVADVNEVGLLGTFNTECTQIQVPVLAGAAGGPLVLVSPFDAYAGLTRPWQADEPDKYYPKKLRNFARVLPPEDVQALAAAHFVQENLQSTKVFVLDDGTVFGAGLAKSFSQAARSRGLTVVGNAQWNASSTSFANLFRQAKTAGAGAVYIAGYSTGNAAQLIKDKVAVLGSNAAVPLVMSDWMGDAGTIDPLPEADGSFVSYLTPNVDQMVTGSTAVASFVQAFKAEYGVALESSWSLYAVAGLQVLLAAIEHSDGTRQGVHKALFTGSGVSVGAGTSMIGKAFGIDPRSGDATADDIAFWKVQNKAKTFVIMQTG